MNQSNWILKKNKLLWLAAALFFVQGCGVFSAPSTQDSDLFSTRQASTPSPSPSPVLTSSPTETINPTKIPTPTASLTNISELKPREYTFMIDPENDGIYQQVTEGTYQITKDPSGRITEIKDSSGNQVNAYLFPNGEKVLGWGPDSWARSIIKSDRYNFLDRIQLAVFNTGAIEKNMRLTKGENTYRYNGWVVLIPVGDGKFIKSYLPLIRRVNGQLWPWTGIATVIEGGGRAFRGYDIEKIIMHPDNIKQLLIEIELYTPLSENQCRNFATNSVQDDTSMPDDEKTKLVDGICRIWKDFPPTNDFRDGNIPLPNSTIGRPNRILSKINFAGLIP